jgi:peptidoglycan/LPS O-acetylase OafA/YrhL
MFLGGCLACHLYKWQSVRRLLDHHYIEMLFSLAAILILVFLFFSSTHMIKTFWRPLIDEIPKNLKLNGWRIPHIWFGLFLSFMLAVTYYEKSWVSRFLQSYWLRHFGLISYSLYLFHMPVLLKLRRFGFKEGGLFFITLIITYLLAYLSYVAVEKPFLLLKQYFRGSA